MTSTLTTIKNGKITLPPKTRKLWNGVEAYIRVTDDTVILKKVYKTGNIFDDATKKKLRSMGKSVTDKDIDKAVKWSRKR